MVSSQEGPYNHPIYVVDTKLGSSIFHNDCQIEEGLQVVDEKKEDKYFSKRQESLENKKREGVWTMYFDGSITKEGDSASVWIISPNREIKFYSFKLTFECTNNVFEYISFFLGLYALKEFKASRIYVFGVSELVINQVNGSNLTKHPRMREYRN